MTFRRLRIHGFTRTAFAALLLISMPASAQNGDGEPAPPADDIKPIDLCPLGSSICSLPGKVDAAIEKVRKAYNHAVDAITPSKPVAPTPPLATRLAEVEACVKDWPSHEQMRAYCQERSLTEAEIRQLPPSSGIQHGRTSFSVPTAATQPPSVVAAERVPLPLSAIAASSPECRPVIARFMRFDPENLSTGNLTAIDTVEKGWGEMVLPAVASSNSPQDIRAALGMTDERIARERPGPGGMARYEYVKCVYQNRLNQLSGVVPPPSPGPDSTRNDLTRGNGSTGRARVRPKYTVGDDYAAGLFQQSIGEAEANSNDPSAAQRIAGNNQRRLEEIDQLTNSIVERSQRNAENVLSLGTAIIGAQAQAQSTYIPPKSTYEPRYTGCIASEDVCEQIRTGLPPSRNRPSSSMEGGGGKQSGGVGSSAPAPYTLGYAADRNWRPPAGASCRSPSQSMMRDTDGAIWCR